MAAAGRTAATVTVTHVSLHKLEASSFPKMSLLTLTGLRLGPPSQDHSFKWGGRNGGDVCERCDCC